MHKLTSLVIATLAFSLTLTSCGNIGEDDETVTPTQEATQSNSSAANSTSPESLASPTNESNDQAAVDCWPADAKVSEEDSQVGHQQWTQPPEMKIDPARKYLATMNTSGGSFVIELLPQDAPLAANNFYCLAEAGYYDNTPFHRIIDGFVIQGGDPTGTGSGGPGYKFADEPVTRNYVAGSVAMANAGPNTNGSQFFVVLDDLTGKLPPNYTNFGQVVEGMDVVDALGKTATKTNSRGEKSVPVEPVTLESVTVKEVDS